MNTPITLSAKQLLELLPGDPEQLIPTIIQDGKSQQVLMLAYTNAESLRTSLKIGEAVFYSRSRQELWHKGLTSGNRMQIVSIALDCDEDTLLFTVIPSGPACHTGEVSCFYRIYSQETIDASSLEL
jgi:phosphoribosyl-AMP cyclohydrolase